MEKLKYLSIVLIVVFGASLFSEVAVAHSYHTDDCCTTYSPGYWKNHLLNPEYDDLDLMPNYRDDTLEVVYQGYQDEMTIGYMIGGVPKYNTYTKEQLVAILSLPTKKDKRVTLFRALVAAQLNDALIPDEEPHCCASAILLPHANMWFGYHPIPPELVDGKLGGDSVPANSEAWHGTVYDVTLVGSGATGGEELYKQLEEYNDGDMCMVIT